MGRDILPIHKPISSTWRSDTGNLHNLDKSLVEVAKWYEWLWESPRIPRGIIKKANNPWLIAGDASSRFINIQG